MRHATSISLISRPLIYFKPSTKWKGVKISISPSSSCSQMMFSSNNFHRFNLFATIDSAILTKVFSAISIIYSSLGISSPSSYSSS